MNDRPKSPRYEALAHNLAESLKEIEKQKKIEKEQSIVNALESVVWYLDGIDHGDAGEGVSDQFALDDQTKQNVRKAYTIIEKSDNLVFLGKIISITQKYLVTGWLKS